MAESVSVYNNAEFLRLELAEGEYKFAVTNHGTVFDATEDAPPGQTETYALAWSAAAIPEPSTWLCLLLGLAALAVSGQARRRRERRTASR